MTTPLKTSDAKRPAGPADPATFEQELCRRLRAGDEAAYETLVREHAGRMLAVARRVLKSESDAADAVQEAFLAAFRAIESFAGDARLGTWLHRIVVNACLMKLRAGRSRAATSIEPLLPTFDDTGHHAGRVAAWGDPLERLEVAELQDLVRARIADLPEPYRVVLLLRDVEELETRATAERLGLTEAAVKVRLHRARMALRTLLAPDLEAHG